MAPNEVGEGEEDALIYRESRVAAAESKKTSAASTHHGTPTRKRSPANNRGEKPSPNPQWKGGSKGTKRESSLEDDQPRKKVAKKKYGRYECSADGCTNIVYSGGVCFRHGAKAKRCSREECTAYAKKGGVCKRHGAKPSVKLCSSEGCTNQAQKGGVCIRHGAKIKRCSTEGCTNKAFKGGVCIRHGAKRKNYRCSSEGCTNNAVKGGVCIKRGAKRKLCSHDGCTNQVVKRGLCWRHGAYSNTHDGSTAFGSEYDETTQLKLFGLELPSEDKKEEAFPER